MCVKERDFVCVSAHARVCVWEKEREKEGGDYECMRV